MHLITFKKNNKINAGVLHDKDLVIDLSFYSSEVPNDVNKIIENNSLETIKKIKS